MTDEHLPPDETDRRDALVSSVLDGEATAGERREVAGDPELMRRLEHARVLRDEHVALAGLDDHDLADASDDGREHRIAAAMAAFDGSDPGPVDLLGEAGDDPGAARHVHGPRRARRPRRVPLVGAAAAVVVVLVVAAVFVRSIGDSTESTAAGDSSRSEANATGVATTVAGTSPLDASSSPKAAPSTPAQPAETADDEATADGAGAAEATGGLSAIPGATPLGTFSDIDDLRRAAVDASAGSAPVDPTTLPCAAASPGGEVVVGVARLDGVSVVTVLPVRSVGATGRSSEVVVLDRATCAVMP